MAAHANYVECGECGATIDVSVDSTDYHVPCPKCGGTKRIIHASIKERLVIRDGFEVKAKRARGKKPFVEDN